MKATILIKELATLLAASGEDVDVIVVNRKDTNDGYGDWNVDNFQINAVTYGHYANKPARILVDKLN